MGTSEAQLSIKTSLPPKGIHIRFLPEKTRNDNLTSPTFAKMVELQKRMVIDRHGVPVLHNNSKNDKEKG